jgi:addiction module HigA family antidote
MNYKLKKIEPGKILKHQFMEKYNLSICDVANAIGVNNSRISQICQNKRQITPDTAVRLGRLFNTTARYWLDLQADYNIEIAELELTKVLITPIG